MRAEDTLRMPPTPVGTGSGRAGGKEQAGGASAGAFEDAVANAGRQKTNDQPGSGKGGNDAAAGSDAEAGALIDKDNIAKAAGRAVTRSISLGRNDQFDEHALRDHFQAAERGVGSKRAVDKTDPAKSAAVSDDLAQVEVDEELAKRIATLTKGIGKAPADGASVDGDVNAGGEGAEAKQTATAMDDLLTLLGGAQATQPQGQTAAARQAADGQIEGAAPVAGGSEHGAKAEAQAGENDPDRLFRFARADGKGQAVSMSLEGR